MIDGFFAKAKEKLSSVTRRGSKSENTSSSTSGTAHALQVPGGVNQTPPNARKKDLAIRVHHVLEKEFEDDITPPTSPSSSSTAAQRHDVVSTAVASTSSASPSPARGIFCSSLDTTPAKAGGGGGASGSEPRSTMSSHDASVLDLLAQEVVDLAQLRRLCWQGCPSEARLECWCLLTGHHQHVSDNRMEVRDRKRAEYKKYVNSNYTVVDWDGLLGATTSYSHLVQSGSSSSTSALPASSSSHMTAAVCQEEITTMKQIRKDIPRTSGGIAFLQHPRVMQSLERVLYIWALRHPACGYVQGMNDLLLPFIYVIFADRVCSTKRVSQLIKFTEHEIQSLFNEEQISVDEWLCREADLYWMSSHMMNSLQENYTKDQAGAHAMVRRLEALMSSVDAPLVKHLNNLQISFQQFAFRWMNCLLLRELSVQQSLRLWDTYLSEESRELSSLHVYVCASFMTRWSPTFLAEDDYGQLMRLLQSPPTFHFRARDMDEIISSAYLMQQLYEHAHGHVHVNK